METTTRPYEISFLVRSEEDVQAVSGLLAEHGAQVTDPGQVRKLALAYPVEKATEGYFGYVVASLEPAAAKKLEDAVRTFKPALRMLVLSAPAPKAEKPAAPKRERRPRAEKAPAEVSNEDLARELEKLTADA